MPSMQETIPKVFWKKVKYGAEIKKEEIKTKKIVKSVFWIKGLRQSISIT